MSNYCEIKATDVADGPGVRVSVFLAGCPHHCRGCFNESTWDYDAGEPFTLSVMDRVVKLASEPFISGLTILGGEPMDPRNQEATFLLCWKVRTALMNKSIWMYTGYTFDTIPEVDMPPWLFSMIQCKTLKEGILSMVDVIVDGPFIKKNKDISLQWRGSTNQRILWKQPDGSFKEK